MIEDLVYKRNAKYRKFTSCINRIACRKFETMTHRNMILKWKQRLDQNFNLFIFFRFDFRYYLDINPESD